MRCEVVRDMAKQANHVIIVSESSKFDQKGTVKLLSLSEVDTLYTDDHINADKEQLLQDYHIDVFKAK